jgi:hypothetical protein
MSRQSPLQIMSRPWLVSLLCDADSASVHCVPRGLMLLALQIPECYVRPIVKAWHTTKGDLSLLSSWVTFHNQQYTTLTQHSSAFPCLVKVIIAGNSLYVINHIIFLIFFNDARKWDSVVVYTEYSTAWIFENVFQSLRETTDISSTKGSDLHFDPSSLLFSDYQGLFSLQ